MEIVSISAQGAWKAKKRVRWADEAEEEDTGFHIGGASLRQVSTCRVRNPNKLSHVKLHLIREC